MPEIRSCSCGPYVACFAAASPNVDRRRTLVKPWRTLQRQPTAPWDKLGKRLPRSRRPIGNLHDHDRQEAPLRPPPARQAHLYLIMSFMLRNQEGRWEEIRPFEFWASANRATMWRKGQSHGRTGPVLPQGGSPAASISFNRRSRSASRRSAAFSTQARLEKSGLAASTRSTQRRARAAWPRWAWHAASRT